MSTTELHARIDEDDMPEIGTAVARQNHQVARREMVGGLIRPVASPDELVTAQEETRTLIARALTKDRDYGEIPGTNKPSLLKPGGERICAAYGVAPRYRIDEKEVDHDREVTWTKRKKKFDNGRFVGWEEESGLSHGLYRYVLECELVHRESGVVIGQGLGSCSTMESKYIDRPRDMENTVIKMASKRAFVGAVLNAFGLSDQFTQDVEDMPREHFQNGGGSTGGGQGPILEREITFGKHKGKTWGAVLKEAPDYIEWAIEKMEKLSQAEKDELTRALNHTDDGTDDVAAEMDRLAEGARTIVRDITAMDLARGRDAERIVEDVIQREGVTAKEIRHVGGQVLGVLQRLQADREQAAAAASHSESEPTGAYGDLPF